MNPEQNSTVPQNKTVPEQSDRAAHHTTHTYIQTHTYILHTHEDTHKYILPALLPDAYLTHTFVSYRSHTLYLQTNQDKPVPDRVREAV